MTLAPTLNTGIAFEQPVEQPNALGAVASLASAFIDTSKPRPQSQASVVAQDKSLFYENLQRGRALIEQGKGKEGERTIRSAYRGFTKRYGLEHDDVNTAFQDATGISADVEVTGSPVDLEQLTSTPEFNITAASLQAQNPEATPDEIFNQAMQSEVQRLQTNMKIQEIENQQKVNWYDVEQTYVDKARQTGDTLRGILSMAQRDQVITPDEAHNLRSFYDQSFGSVTKPVGVDQKSWDQYQEEYIQPLTQIVEGSIGLGQQVGINTDMSRALQQITAKAVAQGKLPASLLVKMQGDSANSYDSFVALLQEASKDPSATENYNFVLNASFDELLNWVTEFEFQTDTDALKVDMTEYESLDPVTKRESLLKGSRLMSPTAAPEQIAPDLIQTNSKLRSLATKALQPEDFATIFNPTYFASIDKVFKANPIIGRQIAQEAVEAIDSQRVAISRALNSEASQLGFKIEGGKILPDENNIPSSVKAWVDANFGGDWGKAFEAKGKAPNGITNAMVRTFVTTAERDLQPKLRKFMSATNAVEQLQEKFLTEEITGQGADETLGGGEGSDFLQPNTATGLIAEFEGFREGAYWDVNAFRAGFGSDTVTLSDGSVKKITEDTVVAREDAERDLARRTQEFATKAKRKVGSAIWTELPGNVTNALTSIAYNYGNIPDRILEAVRSGDTETIAIAVEGLAGDNDGINRNRRMREAAIIRGKELPPSAAPIFASAPPARPKASEIEGIELTKATQGAQTSVQPQSAPVEGEREVRGTEGAETTSASPEATQAIWGQLEDQTKRLLIRLFGNEEEALRAIQEGEISEEDLK